MSKGERLILDGIRHGFPISLRAQLAAIEQSMPARLSELRPISGGIGFNFEFISGDLLHFLIGISERLLSMWRVFVTEKMVFILRRIIADVIYCLVSSLHR